MYRIIFVSFLLIFISASNAHPVPFVTFDNGRLGVDFNGYKASVGLDSLLSGDWSQGGLGASAETPFGQKAAAGLGGQTNRNGQGGGLFAAADSGYGPVAASGLGGVANRNGQAGGLFAGANSGYGQAASTGLGGFHIPGLF